MLDGGQREYLRRQAPDYPRIHLKSGAEGNVLIEVIVGRDGRLKNYRILRSDGRAFTDSAIRALKKYRYKTGTVQRRTGKLPNCRKIRVQARPLAQQKAYSTG